MIDTREVKFARRGFTCSNPEVQERLENIGRVFIQGYSAALADRALHALAGNLNQVQAEQRGFAYEGAAMALALLDGVGLRRGGFSTFVEGAGKQHIFMLHVGAGWAYARLPWMRRRIESVIRKMHPVLRWLVIEGYGFHEGYFHGKTQAGSTIPALSRAARHVFYQGLGRSLWFVKGADVHAMSACIANFPPPYLGDAWSGAGLACAYAGGIAATEIEELRQQAGMYAGALGQGVAFAAKARQLAGNPAKHTDMASALLCQMSSQQAAALCDETYIQINLAHPCPYQHWRELVQTSFNSSSEILLRGKPYGSRVASPLAATKSH